MKILACLMPIAAYLLGSVNFAILFTRYYTKKDVRDSGSGNAGTTNVLRVAGVWAGILTFAFDVLKGAVSAILGCLVFRQAFSDAPTAALYGEYLCGLCCMIGHAFPIFFGFRGGKCAATSVGIFFVCSPVSMAIGLLAWLITVGITRIVSVSTLVATVVVISLSGVLNGVLDHGVDLWIILLNLLAGVIVFVRHRENIGRLLKGQEKKLKIRK